MMIKSFIVVENNGKLLLIKEASKKWRGKWFIPGGKGQKDESPESAAIREFREETGCDVELCAIFALKLVKRIFSTTLVVYFTGQLKELTQPQKASDKHSIERSGLH